MQQTMRRMCRTTFHLRPYMTVHVYSIKYCIHEVRNVNTDLKH